MTAHVIRLARRRTAWESTDVQQLVETEFLTRNGTVDLSASVYVFDVSPAAFTGTLVQVRAEHVASFLNPPRERDYGTNVDLQGTLPRAPAPEDGATSFRFTIEAHRNAVFHDRQELEATLRAALVDITDRIHDVTRREVIEYIRRRRELADPEWLALLTAKTAWAREVDRIPVADT
jgi:hypothetical protein